MHKEYIEKLHKFGLSRIAERIELIWEHPEVEKYLIDLIMNPPEKHSRQGFHPDAFSTILSLYNIKVFGLLNSAEKWKIIKRN